MVATMLLRTCAVLFLSSLSFAGVLRVAPSGAPYTTPQAAIDAAFDGDTILIKPGSYPGFTIQDKALFIAVDPTGVVSCGQVVIQNVSAAKNVVIDSLVIQPLSGTALRVAASPGSVRIQNCTMKGADEETGGAATLGLGAYFTGSSDVVLRSCTVTGGRGDCCLSGGGAPMDAADGVSTRGSTIAMYNCTVRGGMGGSPDPDSSGWGGRGGDGLESPDSFVLAQESSFTGGNGGYGGDGDGISPGGNGGAGGHGVRLSAEVAGTSPQVVRRMCTLTGGTGGPGGFWGGMNGPNGTPALVLVGAVTIPTQTDVLRVNTPTAWKIGTQVPITIEAAPGTSVGLLLAHDTNYAFNSITGYALHVPGLNLRRAMGTVPASGSLTLNVLVPSLPIGIDTQAWYLQAVTIGAGAGATSSLASAVSY